VDITHGDLNKGVGRYRREKGVEAREIERDGDGNAAQKSGSFEE
jgi:hypothetical protein